MPRLKMLRGPEPGLEYALEIDAITIGRGRRNTIVIQDNEVSREHCRLVRVLDDYEIHDAGSTNGTFVNGQQLTESGWLLGAHHIIELGDSITLEYIPVEAMPAAPPILPVISAAFANANTLYLVVKRASKPELEIYPIDSTVLHFGRDVDNDIVLPEREVSRHHMRLMLTDEGYALEDLNTLNGTVVNGTRLSDPMVLNRDALITIGTMVEIYFTDDPEKAIRLINKPDDKRSTDEREATRTKPPAGMTRRINPQRTEGAGHGLQPNQLENSVFIVYARNEWEEMVGPLYAYLEDNHLPAWVDQYLTLESDDWAAAIQQALSECYCLLAIISEASLSAGYLQRSIRHFVTRDKPILLLKYKQVSNLPMVIENQPAIEYDVKNPQRTFKQVLRELQKLRGE